MALVRPNYEVLWQGRMVWCKHVRDATNKEAYSWIPGHVDVREGYPWFVGVHPYSSITFLVDNINTVKVDNLESNPEEVDIDL